MNSFQGSGSGSAASGPGRPGRRRPRSRSWGRASTQNPSAPGRARDRSSELCESPLEERALGGVRGQLERAPVRRGRLGGRVQAPEQVGPGRMEQVVAVELRRRAASSSGRPAAGTVGHRDRDRAVQLDHRARRRRRQRPVQRRRSAASRCPRGAAPARAAPRSPPAAGTDRAHDARSLGRARPRPRRSCRGPTAPGPGPRAARDRRPRRSGRRGESAAATAARAAPAPPARSGSSRSTTRDEPDRLVAEVDAHEVALVALYPSLKTR